MTTDVTDPALLQRFLTLAGRRLRGRWVVLGGAVLPLVGAQVRPTLDIDLAGPSEATNDDILALLEIAVELGLPVEAVNLAAGFFLRRIDGWEEMLVPLHQGPTATLMRPNVTLYLLLKMARLTETDLADCLSMVARAAELGEQVDRARLQTALAQELAAASSEGRVARLRRLMALFVS